MPKKILVVDDSPTELRLIESALEGRGYELETAMDGEEALDKILAGRPDLVLLDVVMPKQNGFQVCRQIKRSPLTGGTKIIMITAKSQETDRFWAMKQGADEYLTKPFSTEELLERIGRVL
jgi:twitching motility two-component system response regulator PilH